MTDKIVVSEDDHNALFHYGIVRRSGRYPWGSGADPHTRSNEFISMVAELKKAGMSEAAIAGHFSKQIAELGLEKKFTTSDLRATTTIARNQKRAAETAQAIRLKYDKGYSNVKIAEVMGLSGESAVRNLLDPVAKEKVSELEGLARALKDQVDRDGYVDVGVGVERYTGFSRTKFDTALAMLKSEDYNVVNVQIDQVGTRAGNKTVVKVLAKPGKTEKEHYVELVKNNELIKPFSLTKTDEGAVVTDPPFLQFDSKRLAVNYSRKNDKGEEIGGALADGVIYVRPGVPDVHLGGARYAQVRVSVDGTHYLKGMAVYKNDLPDGVDLMFNTNKTDTGNKMDALKPLKRMAMPGDEKGKETGPVLDDDPFGSVTRPLQNADGTKRTSVMNVVNSEGDWGNWSRNLASQMLSKQQPKLAQEQLKKAYLQKKAEYDEIASLTNPGVKRKLLESFSDDVDAAAVHLKAAAMDRQATQVIMPIQKMKDTEIFAPNFTDGERVALVRYPHGGKFEIPELVVNNRNAEAIELLGRAAKDAVGINPRVAERLSGADFDGDTVLVIPNNSGKIKSEPALLGLKDFDPKVMYKGYDGMPKMSPKKKQTEMGKVSNLITDMTIKGAPNSDLVRAVRHSMVVIDAEKHNLNYRQSFIDNGIASLKEKYQGGADRGATTLISRTSRDVRVDARKQSFRIDPDTGEKIYTYTGEGYTKPGRVLKDGTVKDPVWISSKIISKEGAEVKNAYDLIEGSGQPIERIYADHANRMKALANEARKNLITTKSTPYSRSAREVYAKEVTRLDAALNVALQNAPRERQAQLLANAQVRAKRAANPGMENDEIKKISGKALVESRLKVGAKKTPIEISDSEWDAIQAGAITNEKLEGILNNTDVDKLKERATPREPTVMTDAKLARAKQLASADLTLAEIASILGVSRSTLQSSLE